MKRVLSLCLAAMLTLGCGDRTRRGLGFKRTYVGFPADRIAASSKLETCASPQVRRVSSWVKLMDDLTKEGYQFIGSAQFKGVTRDDDPLGGWGENDARRFGQELGACLVLYTQYGEGLKTHYATVGEAILTIIVVAFIVALIVARVASENDMKDTNSLPAPPNTAKPVNNFVAVYAVKVKPKVKPFQKCAAAALDITECEIRLPE